jgi:hypothetical protein
LNHENRSETCRKFDSMASKIRYLPLTKAKLANGEYGRRKFRTKFDLLKRYVAPSWVAQTGCSGLPTPLVAGKARSKLADK